MGRLQEYLSEDSNQYGPGTDLMVSLMAVLLIITFINSNLYQREKDKNKGGNFRVAGASFSAGDFKPKPFRELVDRKGAELRVAGIAKEYEALKKQFPYIFVIGHSSEMDDPNALDKSPAARQIRNWDYAGQRAALISSLLEDSLKDEDRDKLVVVSTGEFDKRNPDGISQANAWVEVVFGTEWKRPAKEAAR
jgi:hypothetical protein